MIVKDSGPKLIATLECWKPLISSWTIVDTGSTDSTIDNIRKILGNIPGNLLQKTFAFDCFGDKKTQDTFIKKHGKLPFDFEKARNYALSACSYKQPFIVMIDDTYLLYEPGLLRRKLEAVLDKPEHKCFLIDIQTIDEQENARKTHIESVRIIRSDKKYKWVNPIHEHIDTCGDVPVTLSLNNDTYIYEKIDAYHNNRSSQRHKQDIDVLEICYNNAKDKMEKGRYAFYAAQTAIVLGNVNLAAKWLKIRIDISNDPHQDLYSCLGQYTRHTKDTKWAITAIEMYPSKVEAYFELALIYFKDGMYQMAYSTLRHWMLNYHGEYTFFEAFRDAVKLLVQLAMRFGNYKDCVEYLHMVMDIDDVEIIKAISVCKEMKIWHEPKPKIVPDEEKYMSINMSPNVVKKVVFITGPATTGPWNGLSRDVRGSETSIINIARLLAKKYSVYVFCETDDCDIEDVKYRKLDSFHEFASSVVIDHVICVRTLSIFNDLNKYIKNIRNYYYWLHDATIVGDSVRPSQIAFRKFIFLTDSHMRGIVEQFHLPDFLCTKIVNGIDINLMSKYVGVAKVAGRFIYSSDANRGLYELLCVFPYIRRRLPNATLHVYCDLNSTDADVFTGEYKEHCLANLRKIKHMIASDYITLHGRVNKDELYAGFAKAEYWFYPNTFVETFCITALEAQYFKCKVICPQLGALPEVAKYSYLYNNDLELEKVVDEFLTKRNWDLEGGFKWALEHSYDIVYDAWVKLLS